MGLDAVKIINLPKIEDSRGNLSIIEENRHIPFEIKRSYWIYDVPGGEKRSGHAFISQHEFIVALSGSFDVILNDGNKEEVFHLNRSYYGVYVPNLIWRRLGNFSTNAVALVLSSELYDPNDYIEDFESYKNFKKDGIG
ncbi:sugar 3,4-ketoisomerase [Coprobacter tertius]|uniref:FdtA/QdtA family cupin domain-containing protein n=1 Tax=Coprobacter tertius TaxID=2944915 RepID=A0ABT1MJY1_9BACT|nr:FdtA/QdtA family cupin domain-containing protein [Coprobacter tertius]MCP9612674.1 FdtA/QdtA family cupin domain-containing protein [Coprobacter tertius]